MQTASPHELEVIFWINCRNAHSASALEKKLHKKFFDAHVNGEWHSLTKRNLREIEYGYLKPQKDAKNRDKEVKCVKKIESARKLQYHPDWYYWDWKDAYEPWALSTERERRK